MKNTNYFLWIILIVGCSVLAVAQTGDASNLSGNWIRKAADNSPDIAVAIVQSGTSLTLKILGSDMTGSLQGGKVTVNGIPEMGTVEQNGNSIRWSDGVWVRDGSAGSVAVNTTSPSTPTINTPTPDASSVPDFNGNWVGYYPDGSKSPYIWAIRQTGSTLAMEDVGAGSNTKLTGRVEGNQILDVLNKTATLSADGKRISWSDQVVWVRDENANTTPANPTVTSTVAVETTPPQNSSSLENQCAQMVQGKVAWNRAGATRWDETNIRNLCQGTTNPAATISCFTTEINTHNNWSRAIQSCKGNPNSASTTTLPDLNGKWTGYNSDGSVARNPGTILQNGTLAIVDNGEGSVSQGQIQGNRIFAKDWNLTGTLSSDGKVIRWSNNSTWVKK